MNEVKRIRETAGLTQHKLASLSGTSQPTIAAYESGTKVPSLRTLRRLARAAGFDLIMDLAPAMTREERRSLWIHTHIAERLREDPEHVISIARSNLEKMRRLHPMAHALNDWERILDDTPEQIAAILTSTDPAHRELRHVTPFSGVLDTKERANLYVQFRHAEANR